MTMVIGGLDALNNIDKPERNEALNTSTKHGWNIH